MPSPLPRDRTAGGVTRASYRIKAVERRTRRHYMTIVQRIGADQIGSVQSPCRNDLGALCRGGVDALAPAKVGQIVTSAMASLSRL